MNENKPFWVLENKAFPLYFGICNQKAHWAVGIDDAVKFHNQHLPCVVAALSGTLEICKKLLIFSGGIKTLFTRLLGCLWGSCEPMLPLPRLATTRSIKHMSIM